MCRFVHVSLVGCLSLVMASVAASASARQLRSLTPPTYTEAQATRGAELYNLRCAECHGAALDDGQFAPALVGRAFDQRWQGRSLAEVFAVVQSQMPPDAPGSLTDSAAADVVAFILDQNGFAASSVDLPSDRGQLQTMLAAKAQ